MKGFIELEINTTAHAGSHYYPNLQPISNPPNQLLPNQYKGFNHCLPYGRGLLDYLVGFVIYLLYLSLYISEQEFGSKVYPYTQLLMLSGNDICFSGPINPVLLALQDLAILLEIGLLSPLSRTTEICSLFPKFSPECLGNIGQGMPVDQDYLQG